MHNLTAYIPMDRRLALARDADLPDRCVTTFTLVVHLARLVAIGHR
jgi:hypothetical protein